MQRALSLATLGELEREDVLELAILFGMNDVCLLKGLDASFAFAKI